MHFVFSSGENTPLPRMALSMSFSGTWTPQEGSWQLSVLPNLCLSHPVRRNLRYQ